MSTNAPRLRFVTGKGGVGKTSVATAIALAEARQGKSVLLMEIQGGDRVAALLELDSVGYQTRELIQGLYVVDVNPHDAIHEYALLTLKFEAVYRAVFENRLVRSFLRLIPSLSEFVMLGKIWYHEQELVQGRPRFDVIVVDAPATGHAITMLRTPSIIIGTVPAGPLKDSARQIREMLSDRARTCLHIVTTSEEMAVNEAIKLEQAASYELAMGLGTLFVNRRLAPLPEGALEHMQTLAEDDPLACAVPVLEARIAKRRAGDRHIERLPAHLLVGARSLPRLVGARFGRAQIEILAEEVGRCQGGGS